MLSNQQQQRTVIEIATELVNSVNDLLFSQITIGSLQIDENERPLEVTINKRLEPEDNHLKYKKSKVKQEMEKVDEDEHRKMVRKFMSQNRRIKRKREMKSFEMSEKTLKLREQQQRERQNQKNSILEERRKSIQERMMAKKNMLKQIQRSALQSNSAIASIRKRRFLYQEKEEQYYKNYVLPKMEQERQLLEKRKSYLLKPMDMNQIHEHEKHYEELRVNSRINRSLTISVIKSEQKYHPPQYIPISYKRLKQQQQRERLEEDAKKREAQLNELRKKDFVRKIDQIREKQRELEKSRPQSPKKEESKVRVKQQLNREELKNVGNQYLRQLLNVNRKASTTKRLNPIGFSNTFNVETETRRKPKSEYEIEIIRQERIEQVHKIRNKKIHDLLTNKKMDDYTKQQRLLHQMEKLDLEAEQKMKEDNVDAINESALILMNSIKAKMAYLRVDLSKA